MTHSEHEYHLAGYRYERAAGPDAARAQGHHIRTMLERETPDDQTQARRLIEQGRTEARHG